MEKVYKSFLSSLLLTIIAFFGGISLVNAAQITYHGNGGTPELYSTNNNLPLNVSLPINPLNPNISKVGYNFEGWYDHEQWTQGRKIERHTFSSSSEHLNLWARWELAYYNIEYNLNGGTVEGNNPTSYHYMDNTKLIINPTKNGYVFTGWTGTDLTNPTTQLVLNYDFTGDRSYTANWEVEEYTITYDLDGGSVEGNNPTTYNIETPTFTLINPTKDGYTFIGWEGTDLTGTSENVEVTVGSTGNRNYKAIFEPIEYEITYELDGGVVSEDNPTNYNIESDDITLNNPTKDGYDFKGWTGTDLTEESKEVVISKGSTGNRSYTANWNVIEYSISYDLDGGTLDGQNPTNYNIESDDITLVNPTKEGYKFLGWEGSELEATTNTVIITKGSIGNREYKAIWEEIPRTKVIVHYVDENGKSIKEDKVLEGLVGDEYQVQVQDIEGYSLVKTEGETKGVYAEKDIEITFVYEAFGTGGDEEETPKENTSNIVPQTVDNVSFYTITLLISLITVAIVLTYSIKYRLFEN